MVRTTRSSPEPVQDDTGWTGSPHSALFVAVDVAGYEKLLAGSSATGEPSSVAEPTRRTGASDVASWKPVRRFHRPSRSTNGATTNHTSGSSPLLRWGTHFGRGDQLLDRRSGAERAGTPPSVPCGEPSDPLTHAGRVPTLGYDACRPCGITGGASGHRVLRGPRAAAHATASRLRRRDRGRGWGAFRRRRCGVREDGARS